ncbi:hypothetical protein EHV15_28380 [Paenibacillus oralis]|uniref:Uncharacterized protein n=1 Tax=Paenibacillus oralis TaxID=2490856 RepID=A0A3P3U7R6_9BACL|nr:phage tail spike protein [Paenibacillus oralis]RRJ66402.1 hypothetical protein EHV15_28380 [Paenibacillus oralis]
MLGDIDYNLRPIHPQYFLCKPNREPISKLSEIFNDSLKTALNEVYELSFSLPYNLDIHHKRVRNKNVDLLREKYLIQVVTNHKTEWFAVIDINDAVEQDQDVKSVKCYSTAHELSNKLIKNYSVTSYYCRQVLTDLLANTIWNIGYIDADFDLTYRAFEFPSSTVLEAIYAVAETYNAIVEFDTDARTVSFKKPELFGLNRGLTFSWGKYLKSMNQTTTSDQMVTRLTGTGKDGLTIHKVNPTGQGYIENFGYFMYPFKRDEQRNVISSSYHMSDSLCHALLDLQELVESKNGLFESYLNQLEQFEAEQNQLEADLNKLQNDEAVVTDTMLSQQFDQKMFFEKYVHSGNTSRSFGLNSSYAYAAMIKVDNPSGVSVYLNGQSKGISAGKWMLLGKINQAGSAQVVLNGGNSSVFIQVANISLDEWNNSNNEQEIIERYSLDNKQNQINLKQLEIDHKNRQIKEVKEHISSLQAALSAESNFTADQLHELNPFVIERDFSDDVYVDEKDLYQAVQDKFKELQQPQLSIEVDIVNFLAIVGEQRNWSKLVLGDFVNIKYDPTNTNVTARITQINYDFDKSDIKLTLSNAKSVNDESKNIEKFLSDSKNTNVLVDVSKTKWGQAVVDSSEMSRLFDHFWNKVTNEINMASNEFVTIDRKGITIIDPNDPLRFLRATHGVLGLTRSGGLKYETAISPDGVIAEMVLGKIILGQRVVIGDTTGVFTIEGSRLMIDDRCGRQVLKLGLLEETPDKFGMFINRYASPADCNNLTVLNRTNVTADEGFFIERNKNGAFQKTFYTSTDGDLYMIGNFQAGEGERIFKVTHEGFQLGGSVWATAPLHADMYGNVWMNKLFADSAEITNSLFKDGHIRGSDLELRDNRGGMIKMYPQYGLWFGAENFNDAVASIAMDGTAKFKKVTVTDGNNLLLMDSSQRKIYMNNWDVVGAGAIDAQLIAANIVTATDGFISNLTSSRLTTLTNTVLNGWSDYIRIEGNIQKFITGMADGSDSQKTLPDGRPLYWIDSSQSGQMTTDVTAWPVMIHEMAEADKMILGFRGSGELATPYIQMGAGDRTPNGGKAFIEKIKTEWDFIYYNSNYQKERRLLFKDDGIELSVATGYIDIKHESGTKITIKNNGEIDIVSTGKINVSGTEYNFA